MWPVYGELVHVHQSVYLGRSVRTIYVDGPGSLYKRTKLGVCSVGEVALVFVSMFRRVVARGRLL